MKRFIILFILLLLSITVVSAQFMREIDSVISLTEQGKTNIKFSFQFTDKIRQIDLPIKGDISNIESENGNCILITGVQQILQCKPLQSFFTGETNLSVNFVANGLISTNNNITSFIFDLPIMWNTDRIDLMVQLPFGNALSDEIIVPVSPSNSEIGSDGRRIFIKWRFYSKEPDDIVPIRIYYEPVTTPPPTETNQYILIIVIFAVLFSGILVLYLGLKRKSELVLSVLNEGERIVVEIIQNQTEEEVDQRKIVAMSGFSKAKVSRIIKSLEERGVLESKRLGRRNKIVLKKKFVKEETEQS